MTIKKKKNVVTRRYGADPVEKETENKNKQGYSERLYGKRKGENE